MDSAKEAEEGWDRISTPGIDDVRLFELDIGVDDLPTVVFLRRSLSLDVVEEDFLDPDCRTRRSLCRR